MSKTFRKKHISNKFYDVQYTSYVGSEKIRQQTLSGDEFSQVLTLKYFLCKTEIEKNTPRWKKEYALAHRDKINPNVPKHFRTTLERKYRRKLNTSTFKAMNNLEEDIIHQKFIKNAEWNWF